MASNINANNIDGTYPVAGQDNDSQGFRTNFTNLKNNFIYAKAEIEDLQGKSILKSALTGATLDNNLAGTALTGATVKDFRETFVTLPTATGAVELNHKNGHYHVMQPNGDITLSFAGFTDGVLCKLRFEITITDTGYTMDIPDNTYGADSIAGYDGVTTISFSETGTYVFEFTSYDAALTIHIADLTRARKNRIGVTNSAVAAEGVAGDLPGMMSYDSVNKKLYICVGTYDGSTHIWHRLDLTAPSGWTTL